MKLESTKIKNFIALSDIISLLNMSCGFISIILAFNMAFNFGAIFMLLSLVFDSIDGWVARKINRNDELEFGKNIDSLSDIVSFGIAPAVFLYSISKTIPSSPEILVAIISLIIAICGVLRLTRYNVISNHMDSNDFIGFPIPGIAVILATYYLTGIFNIYIAMIMMFITSLFMISNFKYAKFNNNYLIIIFCMLFIITIITPNILIISNIKIAPFIMLLMCIFYLLTGLKK